MTRRRVSLDGTWDFRLDPDPGSSPADRGWRTVMVPAPWQTQGDELRHATGTAWYRKRFPWGTEIGSAVLHFGAVDYWCRVWLNGHHLGAHEGGYLPFEFEVAEHLEGDNELLVQVVDPGDVHPDYRPAEIPKGKQSWYGPLSGIWQSVWIESRPPTHVTALRIRPDLASGRLAVAAILSHALDVPAELVVRVTGPAGNEAAASVVGAPAGATNVAATLDCGEVDPWSPDRPSLYEVEIKLDAAEGFDRISERVGFRTLAAADGRLRLNGSPIYLRASLDQDYYPGTVAAPPSMEFLEDQIARAKAAGFNCLRCHVKVPDPRYLEAADRLGILVWAELPNWTTFSEAAARRARETLQGMFERDGNHPSWVITSVLNEGWGADLIGDATHRSWLRATYRWLKKLDPDRLVVDNSPCQPNFHMQTDLDDYHHYRAIPERRRQWDEFVAELAQRPTWTFTPNGDGERTGTEPLLVSEFGSWGLPDAAGTGTDWSEVGIDWNGTALRAQGAEDRFHRYGLDRVFGSWEGFLATTRAHQVLALKHQVETIRRHPEIAGYVVTQLTDVFWECNGIFDRERRPKPAAELFAALNADVVAIPVWERTAYWSGEPVEIALLVANCTGSRLEAVCVEWQLHRGEPSGRAGAPSVEDGSATQVASAVFTAPEIVAPAMERLELRVIGGAGRVLATSYIDLSLFPRRPAPPHELSVWAADPELDRILHGCGYATAATAESATVAVSRHAGEELHDWVRRGGGLLVVPSRPGRPISWMPQLVIADRAGGPWVGDWLTCFSWLRRGGPLARLPGGPLLDHSFDRCAPELVVEGIPPDEFPESVYSGVTPGWVHDPAALVAMRPHGRGRVVISTFPITGAEHDPTQSALTDALLELAAAISPRRY